MKAYLNGKELKIKADKENIVVFLPKDSKEGEYEAKIYKPKPINLILFLGALFLGYVIVKILVL